MSHWKSADIRSAVDDQYDYMVDIRRYLHAHPELSFQERSTTALLRTEFAALGLKELTLPMETGAVFVLEGDKPGPTIMIRADIDALPIHENVDVAYRSEVDGVMHACGHDAHAAMAFGVAAILAGRREMISGRVAIVLQPGEEQSDGASRMIEAGVLSAAEPDVVLVPHVASILPVGTVATRPGVLLAGVDTFEIRVSGEGGHAALDNGIGNPLEAAARIAGEFPALVSDLAHGDACCAATLGVLSGGTAFNVVPTAASIEGSLRTFTTTERSTAKKRLRALVDKEVGNGVQAELIYGASAEPVVNDRVATSMLSDAARSVLGADAVVDPGPLTASDDAAEFLARLPGCYFLVGAAVAGRQPTQHHSPQFHIDEEALKNGAMTLARAVLSHGGTDVRGSTR